mgnify:CR=1 FL=1
MIFQYRKNSGEIVMYGDKKNECSSDNLVSVSYKPTKEEMSKIKEGYLLYWKDGLVCEKTPTMLDVDKKEKMRIEYLDDVDKIQKAKNQDELKAIITKLATHIYNQ